MKPLSPIADGAWFHSSKIADITSNLRGTWKDTRTHASTYKVRVTTIGSETTIYIDTCRAHGETKKHNISVHVAGTNALIAWGLRFTKYVGIVRDENTIEWINVLTDRVDYVWNRIDTERLHVTQSRRQHRQGSGPHMKHREITTSTSLDQTTTRTSSPLEKKATWTKFEYQPDDDISSQWPALSTHWEQQQSTLPSTNATVFTAADRPPPPTEAAPSPIAAPEQMSASSFPDSMNLPRRPIPAYALPPRPPLLEPELQQTQRQKHGVNQTTPTSITSGQSLPTSTLVFAKVRDVSHPGTIIGEIGSRYIVAWVDKDAVNLDIDAVNKDQVTRAM